MKKSLSYYHIMHGGVPLTSEGIGRFVAAAILGGYTKEQIIIYLEALKVLKER